MLTVIIPVYNQEDLIIRAIESVPYGSEIIVVNDGSTDNTLHAVRGYRGQNKNTIRLFSDHVNRGVGYAVNCGLNFATGDYIVLLGSDDYFIPGIEKVMKQLDGTDLVYFNLRINDGTFIQLTEENKMSYCGSVKFMRREFIGDTRCPEIRVEEDKSFYMQLLAKNPTEKFTGIAAKHYNFTRTGSLCWLKENGGL